MLGTPGEPVDVWLTDGRPGRFVWRGRMYTVMLVLEHEPGRRSARDRDSRGRDSGARDAGARDGNDRGDDDRGDDDRAGADRECWRVEATPLRAVPPATYELCRDIVTDRWSLLRV
jgi:hypothetical protein